MKSPKKRYFIFVALFEIAQKKSWIALILFILLFILSAWGLRFSKLELDIYDVYDPYFLSSVDLFEMKKNYEREAEVILFFDFNEQPTMGALCSLKEWLNELEQSSYVKTINSIWNLRRPVLKESKLLYLKQVSDPCESKANEIFIYPEELRKSHFKNIIPLKSNSQFIFDLTFSHSHSVDEHLESVKNKTQKFLDSEKIDATIHLMGTGATRFFFKKIMLDDSVLNIFVVLVIILLLRFIYGTWRSGLYLTLTLVATGLVLYGTLALAGGSVNILTNNLFLMTAVAGTADFIFVTQAQFKVDYEESFLKLITPCFFTTLTTVVGFLSLNMTELPLIKQFGNGAALGAFFEWVMMFLFLPCLLKCFRVDKRWIDPSRAYSFNFLKRFEHLELSKTILTIFLVLMVLSFPSFYFLNDQDSPIQNLPKNHPMRQGNEVFKKSFNWESQVYLFFPKAIGKKELEEIELGLKKLDLITGLENPYNLLNEWTEDLPSLKQELISRDLHTTQIWKRYFSEFGELRIPLYLKDQDLHSLRRVRDHVKFLCKDSCRLAGQRIVYLEYGEKITKTMIESFSVSILLVILILLWILKIEKKLKFFIPLVLSALMGPLVILTLLALFQIQLTIVTSIFLAVMVGLAGDNAIQFIYGGEDSLSAGIQDKARSSIVVTLLMIAGSSMFLFQSLYPMKILGLLFIFGFFINLVGDLWGLKKLLN